MENNKNGLIKIGAIAVAVIAIIAIIAGIAGGGYKSPIKDYAKSFEKDDAEYMIDSFSSMYYDAVDRASGGTARTGAFIESEHDFLMAAIESECGEDFKVEIEYGDKEKYSKDEIEDFVDDMEDDYGYEYDADEIKKLYEIEVEMVAEGDDGDFDIIDGTVFVAKVDGDWGILCIIE